MWPDPRSPELLAEIARDGEVLDRGLRGPVREVGLLRGHGWLNAVLPEEFGGRGWGHGRQGARDGFAALFLLGSVSLPMTRIFEGHMNAVRLIAGNGTRDQCNRLFAGVRAGDLLAIWGADGEDPARLAAGGLVGVKTFASGLGEVARAIVTALDEQGRYQMVVVPADEPARWRHSAWDVGAMVGTCSGEFRLEGLAVSPETMLGGPGALFVEPEFNGGVWRLCAAYAGGMAAIAQAAQAQVTRGAASDDAQMIARVGHIQHHAQTALLWAWHACQALENPALTCGQTEGAVAASLFAREAIEQAALAQMALVERVAGTSLHRRASALGRQVRDLRFFLRQAALDAKLATAVALWQGEPRRMLAGVIGEGCAMPQPAEMPGV